MASTPCVLPSTAFAINELKLQNQSLQYQNARLKAKNQALKADLGKAKKHIEKLKFSNNNLQKTITQQTRVMQSNLQRDIVKQLGLRQATQTGATLQRFLPGMKVTGTIFHRAS